MNKRATCLAAGLLALLPIHPALAAEGNVWVDRPHGGYAPQGYVPQAATAWMGMGFNASLSAAPAVAMGPQPAWPVPPGHPAWPHGYPGVAPAMPPAPPALLGGVPWGTP